MGLKDLKESEQKVIKDHILLYHNEEIYWCGWVKWTTKDPTKGKQKFSKKILVVGKYRLFTVSKQLTSLAVRKDFHVFDIRRIAGSDEQLDMTRTDGGKISIRKEEKKGDKNALSEIVKGIRLGHSYVTASIKYNEEGLISLSLDKSLLTDVSPPTNIIAGGLLDAYLSQVNQSKNSFVSTAFIDWVHEVEQTGSPIFDLRTCPGLDSKSDAYLGINTILSSLTHNSKFRVLILKDLQIKGANYLGSSTPKLAISSILKFNRMLTKVVITNNSGVEVDWEEFGDSILSNPENKVMHWEFSSTKIGGRGIQSIIKGVLNLNHALKTLNLANCKLSDKLLNHLIHGFSSAYGVTLPLEELNLSGNSFGELSSASFSTFLGKVKDHWRLRVLGLSDAGSMNWTGLLPSFKNSLGLESLDLSHNKLDKEHFTLKAIFETCEGLHTLNLSNCHLSEAALLSIFSASIPKKNKKINLDVSNNSVSNPLVFNKAFIECKFPLYELNLAGLHLKGKGLTAVLNSLSLSCRFITQLDISRNISSSAEGTEFGASLATYVLSNPQLRRLAVRGGSSNRHALWTLFLNLGNNSTLQELDIEGNSIGDRIFIKLVEALKTNTGLRVLKIDGNLITMTGYQALYLILNNKTNKTLQHIPFPVKDFTEANSGLTKPRTHRLREVLNNISYLLRVNRNGVEVIEEEEASLWEIPVMLEPMAKVPSHLEGEQNEARATLRVLTESDNKRGSLDVEEQPPKYEEINDEEKERNELFSSATMKRRPPTPPPKENSPMVPPAKEKAMPPVPSKPMTEDEERDELFAAPKKKLESPPVPPKISSAGSARNLNQNLVSAIWDYSTSESTELEFKAGDIIEVIEKSDEGWWKGKLNGKSGWFPGNYTEPKQ